MERGLIDSFEIRFNSAFRNLKSAILTSPLPFALSFLGALLFALCSVAQAQQAQKVYRVGILRSGSPSSYLYGPQHDVIRQGLRTLAYIEGSNLLIEYRYAENKLDRLPELARELVGLKVDILVISPSQLTIRAALEASRTIPIVVMGATVDPVQMGFAKSLARPGGNITGLTNLDTELHGKRLGLLKEAFPPVSRVAIIMGPLREEQAMKEVEPTAKALGIQVIPVRLEDRLGLPSLESAFSTISQERAGGLIVPSMRTTLRHRGRVVDFAAKSRLPTIYSRDDFVDVGGLMSYSADLMDVYRRVATYVDKILKGSNPAELPIEQPTKFEFVINLRTAKALNLTIPQSVLFRATKVIK